MTLLTPQEPGAPVGAPSESWATYWEGCRRGELWYCRCAMCDVVQMKPSRACAACGSRELAWLRSHGFGRLYSWTVVWRPQHPSFHVPYAPAIVELDEGFWLMTAMVGCEPEELRADLPVQVEFHAASEDVTLPYFRPR